MGSDKLKIAVICHDAGAAEILVAYIHAHVDEAQWTLYTPKDSPCERIAKREGLATQENLDLDTYDALFFGTGWQNKIERTFVQKAKRLGIPSFAFLDHWSSYRERFDYPDAHWRDNLPDFVVVSDTKAEEIAKRYALSTVLRVNNHYLQKQLSHLQTEESTVNESLLFLSEPTREVALSTYGDPMHWGFDQYSALEEILRNFDKFQCKGLSIRLHPSEKNHNYNTLLKKFPHIKSQIYPAALYPLEKDLLRSKMIIGFDTMALYTAALSHKPVLSFLPSDTRDFLLPLPPSHQLRSLKNITPKHLQAITLDLPDDGIHFAVIRQKIKEFASC